MILKTFSFQGTGTGTIVVDDDATNEEIAIAMMLDAMEEQMKMLLFQLLMRVFQLLKLVKMPSIMNIC